MAKINVLTPFLVGFLALYTPIAKASGWRKALCLLRSVILDEDAYKTLPTPKLQGEFRGAFHTDVAGQFPDIKLINPAADGNVRQLSAGQLVLQSPIFKDAADFRNPSIIAKIPKKRPNQLKLPDTKAGDLVVVRVAVGKESKIPDVRDVQFDMPPPIPTPDLTGLSDIEISRAKNRYGYANDRRTRNISARRRQAIKEKAASLDQAEVRRSRASQRAFDQEKRLAEWTERMSREITKKTKHPEFFIPVRRWGNTNHLTSKYNAKLVPLDVWIKRVTIKNHF